MNKYDGMCQLGKCALCNRNSFMRIVVKWNWREFAFEAKSICTHCYYIRRYFGITRKQAYIKLINSFKSKD